MRARCIIQIISLCAGLLGLPLEAEAHPEVFTGSIGPGPFCAGQDIGIPFSVKENFRPGNIFTVQLSDSSGSFDDPHIVGSVSGISDGMVVGPLPLNLVGGTRYRIRVVASRPAFDGSDNGEDITINVAAFVSISPRDSITICEGDSVVLTADPGLATYEWSNGKIGSQIKVSGGIYSVLVRNSVGCRAIATTKVIVVPRPRPEIVHRGDTLDGGMGYASYQWYRDSIMIQGATSQSYHPTEAGRYAVRVSDSLGCTDRSIGIVVNVAGVTNDTGTLSRIRLHPQPVGDRLTVEAFLGEPITPVEISISDINGVRIFGLSEDRVSGKYHRQIMVGHLPPGTYLFQLEAAGQRTSEKFMKR